MNQLSATCTVKISFGVSQPQPKPETLNPKPIPTVDDRNPAVPIINIPQFPQLRVLKVMQDLYHQP